MIAQYEPMGPSFFGTGLSLFALLSGLVSFLVLILWLVVAWRAMRAHEEIADALRELSRPE